MNPEHSNSAVISAIRLGDVEQLWSDLRHGADPNTRDEYGETLLINAARGDSLEIVKVLIKAGAKIDFRGERGWTALRWAIDKRNEEIASYLIDSGANVNSADKHKETPLFWAVFKRMDGLIRILIERGADVNVVAKANSTCLRTAASYPNNLAIVRMLVENGARLGPSPFDLFFSAVSTGAIYGDLSILEYLLDQGLECYERFPNGQNVRDFLQKHLRDKKGIKDVVNLLNRRRLIDPAAIGD